MRRAAFAALLLFGALLLAEAAVLVVATLARADEADFPRCADPDVMLDRLAAEYGERAEVVHRTANGGTAILTASPRGSWSFVVIGRGRACILAFGDDPSTKDAGRDGT